MKNKIWGQSVLDELLVISEKILQLDCCMVHALHGQNMIVYIHIMAKFFRHGRSDAWELSFSLSSDFFK